MTLDEYKAMNRETRLQRAMQQLAAVAAVSDEVMVPVRKPGGKAAAAGPRLAAKPPKGRAASARPRVKSGKR